MSQRPGPSVRGKALGLGAAALLLWLAGSAVFRGAPDQKPGPLAPGIAARPPGTAALIERLRRTTLRNGDEIYRRLDLGDASFFDAAEVRRWYSSRRGNAEVCAVGFVDPDRVDYRLRTFPDRESALAEGYAITHRDHCGTCSSLRNLAVYLEHSDLTSPVRNCARRWTAGGVKACLMEEIRFEEHCGATWARNVLHTRRRCLAPCIGHYGLWNVLTNDIRAPNTDEDGNLNPCLACDERVSGPGFQYAAGRTRRNSGLTSAIMRPASEIYAVDHRLYFR